MRTLTLKDLRTAVRDRADMTDDLADGFVTDPELTRYISSSYTWLWAKLVQAQLGHPEEKEQAILTTAGITAYPVPADYLATLGVDWLNGTEYQGLRKFDVTERNRYQVAGSSAVVYRVVGTGPTAKVRLAPPPPAGQTYRHVYIPGAPVLENDDDLVDGVNGWEELLILDAAIKCVGKEGDSAVDLKEERRIILARIDEEVEQREQTTTHTVRDVRGCLDDEGSGGFNDPADWRHRS